MRVLAVTVILMLFSGVPSCFAGEMKNASHVRLAQTDRLQELGPGQTKSPHKKHRKDAEILDRALDQRDWDRRKVGRDWRMRRSNEDAGH